MPKINVKDNGVWREVKLAWVKQNGVWVNPKLILVYNNGVGQQVYPDIVGPTVYSSYGSYTYTVPAGVTSLAVDVYGGSGGQGGNDVAIGANGYTGNRVFGNITVIPGEVLTFHVGGGGVLGGSGGQPPAGNGGASTLTYTGGTGSPGGASGFSGSGGGGGAATVITRGGTPILVAGGGGGGGGAGRFGSPVAQVGVGGQAGNAGGSGIQSGGDGGGGGGGGGGVNGGSAGASQDGEQFGVSGNQGSNLVPAGCNAANGTASVSGNGTSGSITVLPNNVNTALYTTNGSFTVPTGVTRLRITAVGGGGGGAGSLLAGCGSVNHSGGSGGGGGAIARALANVTPGQTISFTVGAGGAPGAAYDNRGTFGGEGANSGYNGGNTLVTGSGFSITAEGGRNGRAPGTGTSEYERVGNNCGHSAVDGGVGGTFSLSGVTDVGSLAGGNGGAGGNNGASGGNGASVSGFGSGGSGGLGSGGAQSGAGGGGGGGSYGNGGVGGRFQTGLNGSGNGANYGAGGGGMGGEGGGYGGMGTGFGAGGVVIIEYGPNI